MPIYELRTYYAHPGRLDAMLARFAHHTDALITKHGMKTLAYWLPRDGNPKYALVYLMEHESQASAERNWAAFSADPEWKRVKTESELDGPITASMDCFYMDQIDLAGIR